MVTKEQIGKSYTKAVGANTQAAAIAKKAKTYADALKYAELIGKIASQTLIDTDIAWDADMGAAELVVEVLRKAHGDVTSVTFAVQLIINQDAGLGLSPLVPKFDVGRAVGLAGEVTAGDVITEAIISKIINNVSHTVDESVRVNMQAQENVGLYTYITREYDGVGLSNGRTCEWCLARQGTWTHYQDALDAGVFERHDNCHCVIDYKVGKTHTIGTDKYTWKEA